jgi:predicted RNA binding protein YcfA (HicA-like mRNA interferase family)
MKCSELLRLFKKAGWVEDRQSGSHVIMKHPERGEEILIVPNHGTREIGKGLAEKLKKQAGLK